MTLPNISSAELEALIPEVKNVVPLSSGGQKRVFTCDISGIKYVLKVILASEDIEGDAEESELQSNSTLARAEREVGVMATLDCPTLVKLGPLGLRYFKHNRQNLLVFSEVLIPGTDLKTHLRTSPRLPFVELVSLLRDIAAAIDALWEAKKIHRDIKPANIMRTPVGRFTLLDVGYAYDLLADSLTGSGLVVGTAMYLAPEQMNPSRKAELDFRLDLFALGVVAYEAATGQHPFMPPGTTSINQVYGNILGVNPIAPSSIRPEIAGELEEVIMRLLAKEPHGRFRNCEKLLQRLGEIVIPIEDVQ